MAIGEEAMADWGWRIAFLLAGSLRLIGPYLRSRFAETPIFEELGRSGKSERSAEGGSRTW